MSTTSIGPGPEHGGNESHMNVDHMGNKTLGEEAQQPEAGLVTEAAPDAPAGPPASKKPPSGISKTTPAGPRPEAEAGPTKLEADRDKMPKR